MTTDSNDFAVNVFTMDDIVKHLRMLGRAAEVIEGLQRENRECYEAMDLLENPDLLHELEYRRQWQDDALAFIKSVGISMTPTQTMNLDDLLQRAEMGWDG